MPDHGLVDRVGGDRRAAPAHRLADQRLQLLLERVVAHVAVPLRIGGRRATVGEDAAIGAHRLSSGVPRQVPGWAGGAGGGGRRVRESPVCHDQAVPSHQRRGATAHGSAYQPGAGAAVSGGAAEAPVRTPWRRRGRGGRRGCDRSRSLVRRRRRDVWRRGRMVGRVDGPVRDGRDSRSPVGSPGKARLPPSGRRPPAAGRRRWPPGRPRARPRVRRPCPGTGRGPGRAGSRTSVRRRAVVDRHGLGPVGHREGGGPLGRVLGRADELGERALAGLAPPRKTTRAEVMKVVPVSMAVGAGVPWT